MNNEKATPEQVFALAGRFASEVNSWGLPRNVVLEAKEQSDHPLWEAIRGVLVPKLEEQPVATEVVAPLSNKVLNTPRIQVLRERPKPCAKRTVDDQVSDLKRMYTELGWTWIESGLVIPERQKGIDRLIVSADVSLTNNRAFGVCEASFPSWRYADDLDLAVPADKDERHPVRGPYAIWVKDDADSDYDLRNISADMIAERALKTETFLERGLHELIHYRETGEHLDTRTLTLCSGSRNSRGDVPCAYWGDDGFRVYWFSPGGRNPNIRARQAVTL
jgi:hypothetical protein